MSSGRTPFGVRPLDWHARLDTEKHLESAPTPIVIGPVRKRGIGIWFVRLVHCLYDT